MELLNRQEKSEVVTSIGDAITKLCNALAIVRRAQERVVNESVNVTINYDIRDAIQKANDAARQAMGATER